MIGTHAHATRAIVGHADPVQRIVGHEDVVAAGNGKPGAINIMNDVVDDLEVVGFVMEVRRLHEIKIGALARLKPRFVAVVKFVALDTEIGRSPRSFQDRWSFLDSP